MALFAGGLATFAELYATQAVPPELAHEFDLSPSASALSLSTATSGIGIGLIVVGPLTESLGRTLLMRTSLVASGVIGICGAPRPSDRAVRRWDGDRRDDRPPRVGFRADAAGWRWGVAAVAGLGVACRVVVLLILPASRGFRPSTGGLHAAWTRTRAVGSDPGLLLIYAVAATVMGGLSPPITPSASG